MRKIKQHSDEFLHAAYDIGLGIPLGYELSKRGGQGFMEVVRLNHFGKLMDHRVFLGPEKMRLWAEVYLHASTIVAPESLRRQH